MLHSTHLNTLRIIALATFPPASPPAAPPSSSSSAPRRLRVVRKDSPAAAATTPASPSLATDSLGWSLLLAARVLAAVHAGKSLSEALGVLASEPPSARAAAQDIAYGVLRRYGWGEFILGRLMTKPLTHGETQALLLAALYRLDTRPEAPHTVVDQAVIASGELAGGVFKGVVNGVLRNFLRRRDELLAAMAEDEEAVFQHPRWWLARLRRTYRDDWQAIVAAGNEPPPMTLRVNLRRGTVADYLDRLAAAGLSARPVGHAGLVLQKPVPVDALPGFFDGLVSVQDAGAQRAAELLAPAAGARVLDACAAPGGKAAHMLERAAVELLALDADARRLPRVHENLARLGLVATVRAGDAAQPRDWWDGRPFARILLDAPCSASGILRRQPDVRLHRRPGDLDALGATQARLLDALWPLLAPGGRLVYATCSVFNRENAALIDAFLSRHADARACPQAVPEWFGRRSGAGRQNLPGDGGMDGFFYAVVDKRA